MCDASYDQRMTTTKNIVDSIERRIRDAKQEIAALTAAQAALNGRHGTKGSRRKAASKADGARRNDANATADVQEVAAGERRDSQPTAGNSAPPRSRRRARRSRRARSARGVEVVPAGKLELLLAKTAGLTTSALANQANADRDQVLTLLRELELAGRVRRQGQRRATRWHVITDEERIHKRAAELDAQRKPAAKLD